jgi:hypoxanthine phosphoribosyltransferase
MMLIDHLPQTLVQLAPGRLETLLSEAEIQAQVKRVAAEINATYRDCRKLIVIGVLKGAFMFLADLLRHIEVPVQVETIRLASYDNATQSSGTIRPVDLSLPNLNGEDVLIVEDIVDTGLTMSFLIDYLQNMHHTKSLRLAVLLDKPLARKPEATVNIDYTAFTVGNEFVVGYGLDYAGYFRNLPFIAVVKQEEDAVAPRDAV